MVTLAGYSHISLSVRDRDASVRWYGEVLGFAPFQVLDNECFMETICIHPDSGMVLCLQQHPDNVDEETADLKARVAFVASGDFSIQIVDSYSYRLRGRIPIRSNLYGPLRAVLPSAAEKAADATLVVKLFGLTPEGLVMIDVHASDIQ